MDAHANILFALEKEVIERHLNRYMIIRTILNVIHIWTKIPIIILFLKKKN